jgi:hypothetical protein
VPGCDNVCRVDLRERLVRGLARNPAVPADVLIRLVREWPEAMSWALRDRAVLPDTLQDEMGGHPSWRIRATLGDHPGVRPDWRVRLLADPDWRVRLRIVGARTGPPVPDEVLARLMVEAFDADPEQLHTPGELFEEAFEGDWRRIRFAARHPDARVRRMVVGRRPELVAGDPDSSVAEAAAAAIAERERIMQPSDLPDRVCHYTWYVLQRPLSRALAEQVAASGDIGQIEVMAGNPTLPADLVETLSRYPAASVREAVANRESLPSDLVRRLAEDPDPLVRCRVAKCRALPRDLVHRLAADPDHTVRTAIEQFAWLSDEDRTALVSRQPPGHERAVRWARSDNLRLRRRAAEVTTLPSDLVALLTGDPDQRVRATLATHHPGAPAELLLRCYLEGQFRAKLESKDRFPTAGFAGFAGHDDAQVRRLALRDPELGPEIAGRLTRDPDEWVRKAAARCPRLPESRILELLDDPELATEAAANPALPWRAVVAGL